MDTKAVDMDGVQPQELKQASQDGGILDRVPQPYLLRQDSIHKSSSSVNVAEPRNQSSLGSRKRHGQSAAAEHLARRASSPSDSGTEADDEAHVFIRALPPPPLRPRKGLRVPHGESLGLTSPLLTPTRLEAEQKRLDHLNFEKKRSTSRTREEKEALEAAEAKFTRKRNAELVRRATECALCVSIALGVAFRALNDPIDSQWVAAAVLHGVVFGGLITIWPIRLMLYSWRGGRSLTTLTRGIRLPVAFDPAPLLYPVYLPLLIALSTASRQLDGLALSFSLTLAALPPIMVPRFGTEVYNSAHWVLTLVPLLYIRQMSSFVCRSSGYACDPSGAGHQLSGSHASRHEIDSFLFPLHQVLVTVLGALTTTSLLSAELSLLATALISLLLFSSAPHAVILSTLLWVGGLGTLILCGPAVRWGVLIARIPRWRFRRGITTVQAHQGLVAALKCRIDKAMPKSDPALDSSGDDDECEHALLPARPTFRIETLKADIIDTLRSTLAGEGSEENATWSAVERVEKKSLNEQIKGRKRSNTLPGFIMSTLASPHAFRSRRTGINISTSRYFLSLTAEQATRRKWLYAGYVYATIILLILLPVRYVVAVFALHGHDPFGWAIGYLFGNVQPLRFQVFNWSLGDWILLPPLLPSVKLRDVPFWPLNVDHLRLNVLGAANTRLLLIGYCGAVLTLGLTIVLSLPAQVEVDTRRKVFHGMMVVMLLPTIPIDPSFVALALALMLAIFLILDLLRASQLPPLSKPIATFLTPYVDGRDLRGPVVISHIFLLIGCAIPLWLSLAGRETTGQAPWEGWEIKGRDVSMVAGVICVGMGDAAASLIGRRYGRRKWPWAGGKSLEGSLAFAAAVMLGLLISKLYLWLGSWETWPSLLTLPTIATRAGVAACGASLMEAVLTGGNDNVVVPIVLWLLVRCLDL